MSLTISVMQVVADTTVDGPGFRTSVYCAGCLHHCVGCHNQQTWDFNNGIPKTPQEIWEEILRVAPYSDVTFSGGDPLFQVEGFIELAKIIKTNSTKTIWCYTGFTFEEVLADPKRAEILKWIDVLVDGRFILGERDTNLVFRGSKNQRLIDVKESLKQKKVVLYHSLFMSAVAL